MALKPDRTTDKIYGPLDYYITRVLQLTDNKSATNMTRGRRENFNLTAHNSFICEQKQLLSKLGLLTETKKSNQVRVDLHSAQVQYRQRGEEQEGSCSRRETTFLWKKALALVPPVAGGEVADDEAPRVARTRRRTGSFRLRKGWN